MLGWTLLAAAGGYAVSRIALGYPRPQRRYTRLLRHAARQRLA